MRVEDCYWVGEIRRPHGIKGEVKAYFDVDYLEEYIEMESVYLLTGQKLTPFFVAQFRAIGPNLAILAFRDIVSREMAESLSGSGMYLPTDQLPDLEDGQFYYHDVIGYQVSDQELGLLGEIRNIVEMPAQDVMVMDYEGSEILIPITENFVLSADHETKQVMTNLPEGLIDIYLPNKPSPPQN